jgi:hypothetical protein
VAGVFTVIRHLGSRNARPYLLQKLVFRALKQNAALATRHAFVAMRSSERMREEYFRAWLRMMETKEYKVNHYAEDVYSTSLLRRSFRMLSS